MRVRMCASFFHPPAHGIFSVIVWPPSDLVAILNRDALIVLGVSHPPFSFIGSAEWSMFAHERRQERRKSAKHEG